MPAEGLGLGLMAHPEGIRLADVGIAAVDEGIRSAELDRQVRCIDEKIAVRTESGDGLADVIAPASGAADEAA